MISMDKKYRTRDGRDVRLLCVDGGGMCPVVGFVGDELLRWADDGLFDPMRTAKHSKDLIEYHEPDIRTIWVNVYENGGSFHISEEAAKLDAGSYGAALAIAQPVTFEVKREG